MLKSNLDIDRSKAQTMCLLACVCTCYALYSLQWGWGCKIKHYNLSLSLFILTAWPHGIVFSFIFSSWVVCKLCLSFNPLTDSDSALCLICGGLKTKPRQKGQCCRKRVVWKCERSLSAPTDWLAERQGYIGCHSFKWNIVMNWKSYNLCCLYALSS